MVVAILEVRPALESGVGVNASGAKSFVPPFALEPRAPDRRRLLCYWRSDRDGRLVAVWESGRSTLRSAS
jgi:hypothetical protein